MRTHTAPRCCQACAPEREAYLGGARTPQRGEIARRRAARRTGPGTTRPQPARLRPVAPVPPLHVGFQASHGASHERGKRPLSDTPDRPRPVRSAGSLGAPRPHLLRRLRRGRVEGCEIVHGAEEAKGRARAPAVLLITCRASLSAALLREAPARRAAPHAHAHAPLPLRPLPAAHGRRSTPPYPHPPLPRQPPDCLRRAQRRAS